MPEENEISESQESISPARQTKSARQFNSIAQHEFIRRLNLFGDFLGLPREISSEMPSAYIHMRDHFAETPARRRVPDWWKGKGISDEYLTMLFNYYKISFRKLKGMELSLTEISNAFLGSNKDISKLLGAEPHFHFGQTFLDSSSNEPQILLTKFTGSWVLYRLNSDCKTLVAEKLTIKPSPTSKTGVCELIVYPNSDIYIGTLYPIMNQAKALIILGTQRSNDFRAQTILIDAHSEFTNEFASLIAGFRDHNGILCSLRGIIAPLESSPLSDTISCIEVPPGHQSHIRYFPAMWSSSDVVNHEKIPAMLTTSNSDMQDSLNVKSR